MSLKELRRHIWNIWMSVIWWHVWCPPLCLSSFSSSKRLCSSKRSYKNNKMRKSTKRIKASIEMEKTIMLVESSGPRRVSEKEGHWAGGVAKLKSKWDISKGIGFHYRKDEHCKGNCKVYLESKKKKDVSDAPSSSRICVIKVNIVYNNNIWVLDTSWLTHIYLNMKFIVQYITQRGE